MFGACKLYCSMLGAERRLFGDAHMRSLTHALSTISAITADPTCCGHAGDVEALLPLLLDPFKGEGVADLVALLRVPGALAHDHQGAAMTAACSISKP